MAKKKAEKDNPFEKARLALKKAKVEDSVVPIDDSIFKQSLPHIPTGSIAVDYLIGGAPNKFGVPPCPGWPRGRISQLYGKQGAGKTTLALTSCASVTSIGGTAAYIDFENEVETRYASILGVPVTDNQRFLLIQPTTLEEGFQYMIALAAAGVDMIVVDSVGAGVPEKAELSLKDMGTKETRMGLLAAQWSKFLPKVKRVISKSGTHILGISQLRKSMKTGPYAPDYTVQGGEAWKFYSSIRMMLRPAGKSKQKVFNAITNSLEEQVTGFRVKAHLDKCKVHNSYAQFQYFYLRSGEGIDDLQTILEMAMAHKIVIKKGSWYSWTTPDGDEIKAQGEDKFRKLLIEGGGYVDVLFGSVNHLFSQVSEADDAEEYGEELVDESVLSAINDVLGNDDDEEVDTRDDNSD